MPDITRSIPETFLECRIHHAWSLIRDRDQIPERPGAMIWNSGELWSQCLRCGTTKFVRINVLGARAGGGYLYPDGYSIDREHQPSKDQLRVEVTRRIVNPSIKAAAKKPAPRGRKKAGRPLRVVRAG